jgi:hypothetical protein
MVVIDCYKLSLLYPEYFGHAIGCLTGDDEYKVLVYDLS